MIAEVEITQTGNRTKDGKLATEAAGLAAKPENYVWHHHQDGKTMQLIPADIHEQTAHTGGYRSVTKMDGNGDQGIEDGNWWGFAGSMPSFLDGL